MKLGNKAGGVCPICGSDTMGAEIDSNCKFLFSCAKDIVLKQYTEDSLKYNYGIESHIIMESFKKEVQEKIEQHKGNWNTAFKIKFKREFSKSVLDFYNEKGFVSKKQLDIVKRFCDTYKSMFGGVQDSIIKEKKHFIKNFEKKHFEEIVEVARNLWKDLKQK